MVKILVLIYCRLYASVNWVSIGSGNGLSPVRRQAITWTNAKLLSIGLLGTNFSEIQSKFESSVISLITRIGFMVDIYLISTKLLWPDTCCIVQFKIPVSL